MPNSSFEVVEAVIDFFCFDKDLVNLMMLDMKIGCLYERVSSHIDPSA